MAGPQNRLTVVNNLEQKHEITRVITENLCRYMEKIRKLRDGKTKCFFVDRHRRRCF